MRKCSGCLKVKMLEDFPSNGGGTKYYACRVCDNVRNSERKKLLAASNKFKANKIKLNSGCVDCGYRSHAEALDFDHLPQFKKYQAVSQMLGKSWSRVEAEIAKCEVVCANCHRVRTANRRNKEK